MEFGAKQKKSSKTIGVGNATTMTKKVRELLKCDPSSSTSTMATDLTYLDDSIRTSSSTLETISTTNICSTSSLTPPSAEDMSQVVIKVKSNDKPEAPLRVKYPPGTKNNIQINSYDSNKLEDNFKSTSKLADIMIWKTSSLPSTSHLPVVMGKTGKKGSMLSKKLTCSVSNIKRHYDKNHNIIDTKGSDTSEAIKPKPLNTAQSGLTFKVLLGTFVATFTNSIPSGYNMGVVNTPQAVFMSFFNASLNNGRTSAEQTVSEEKIELYWSIAVSLLVIGAIAGSAVAGYLADMFGRRGLIFANSMIGVLGISMAWVAKFVFNVPTFMVGRLVAGVHTGIASSLVPMYLMEISPKNLVSVLGSVHVIGLTGGLLLAQILGLEGIMGSESRWHMLFITNSIFIMVGLVPIYFCPESPVYLFVMRKKEEKAIEVLQSIRRRSIDELTDDIAFLRQEQKNKECNNKSFLQTFQENRNFRKALFIVCGLHAGQQLVGINAIIFYSTSTFRNVGLTEQQSQLGSIGCAFLNCLSCIISMPLLRRSSPRRLLMVSTIGTIICLILMTISMTFKDTISWLNYVAIIVILSYVFIFSIGQGPIPFMIGGELFDGSTMAIGLSAGCLCNWFCNSLVAFSFPTLVLYIKQYVFLLFLIFDFLVLLLVIFVVPDPRKNSHPENNAILTNTLDYKTRMHPDRPNTMFITYSCEPFHNDQYSSTVRSLPGTLKRPVQKKYNSLDRIV